ncbi:NAD-glutamate dehydrogenase [Halorhodospira halophila]|uniref:Glutamate dehydrogenase (NAD) n=1 Tax=Halorhodospira halophila (strain DSM 244 / SL1) TaxID=349124 RepID=A1WVU5_HALHL|nr:NAD-glutamate dehydrogenase [Halorhodospira halophila]ABM61807.1 glutamate dehydrogenase (NAD) [Halorhodospira halophila SL1]MBK1728865.1 NAD-glutamate dehydrogenase [Halorhodospira halophila]
MTGGGDWQQDGSDDPRRHLLGLIGKRWPQQQADDLGRFLVRYHARVAAEDLEDRTPEDLFGAAVAHWRLAGRRSPGESAIHVYNPDPEQHGWESRHTVVDLVVDDRAFLIDSVTMALQQQGLTIHRLFHPVLAVWQREQGEGVDPVDDPDAPLTAFMHFEVDRRTAPEELERLRQRLQAVLADVATVVDDWRCMRSRLLAAADELQERPPPALAAAERAEVDAFLRWAAEHHFTFIGYRAYRLCQGDDGLCLVPEPEGAYGILRDAPADVSVRFAALPPEVQQRALEPEPLILTQSNSRSPVHRPGPMDYLGVKRFDEQGRVVGEHRFLGLYTSAAYYRSAQEIPLLRRKVAAVLQRAGYPPESHAGKALLNILETYPRDELFQIDVDELERIARAVLHLRERPRVRLLVRYDPWQRFASCLVYVPRERYDTANRQRIQGCLEQALGAPESDFSVQLGESLLARIRFILPLPGPGVPDVNLRALEQRLAEAVRSWADGLQEALQERLGEEQGSRLAQRYADAFPVAYRQTVPTRVAAQDVERVERVNAGVGPQMVLYHPLEAGDGGLRFKLFHGARPASLSDALPVLEHMGLRVVDEQPFEVLAADAPVCWIHDFGLSWEGAGRFDTQSVAERFRDAFAAVWAQAAESDGFNRLVLAAGLDWREVALLRAYARYLRQIGSAFSQAYMAETLAAHPRIAALLVALFHARFDPERADAERAAAEVVAIREALHGVASLDQDRILRQLLAALEATVRTNHYAVQPGAPLALKLRPAGIPDLPRPVPWAEVFVYAPAFEGVHLRGGEVARGGLRWSTRREDYRSEVLGLMKAQIVKNAAIVPVGAKGGFVVKDLPEAGAAQREAVRAAYRAYIDALLQITDNLRDGRAVAPQGVLRHDGDDPYLVVAADKGTASFSDLANSVSAAHAFWLDDAFASGGSAGYDHKAMGITARGAWESVRRHFRELGRDVQRESVTVVGIGDMSGDVFGNGMLCSEQIRLLAAFDHRHVFIDPEPDPARAYAERQRLFALEASSWADYDPDRISAGGGVYPRSAKSVSLSAEACRALGIETAELTPDELIQAVLRAPVDLLWNGGIGTYVKAREQSHAEVGDKATDSVRVDARQLRCRVVGEGGNLGFTQAARVEYAAAGGRINTDAIDNVGGVACSDYEVNIKILLNGARDDGELTGRHRDALLAEMTEQVAERVLETCRAQAGALSLAEAEAPARLDEHVELMRRLERDGILDRSLEGLPDDEALAERAARGVGLLRPELAVLLAYAKIVTQRELRATALLDEAFMEPLLFEYFPPALGERYPERIRRHRLRRELIATAAANRVVNRMGETFCVRMAARSGCAVAEVVRAWYVAEAMFGLDTAWEGVEARVDDVEHAVVTERLQGLRDLHEHATLWLLRNAGAEVGEAGAAAAVARVQPSLQRLSEHLVELLPDAQADALMAEGQRLEQAGLPPALARRVAALPALYPALDWVKVAEATGADELAIAASYFQLVERLGLAELRHRLERLEAQDGWQVRFREGLVADYDLQLRGLTAQLVTARGADPAAVEPLLDERRVAVERLQAVLTEVQQGAAPGSAVLAVAVQELKALVQVGDARRFSEP